MALAAPARGLQPLKKAVGICLELDRERIFRLRRNMANLRVFGPVWLEQDSCEYIRLWSANHWHREWSNRGSRLAIFPFFGFVLCGFDESYRL